MEFGKIISGCVAAVSALLLAGQGFCAQPASDESRIRKMLLQPADKIDLLEIKLAVDKAIDPSIDVDATRKKFDAMASYLKGGLPATASSAEKLRAIRVYLYGKGPWNNSQPFQYDFNDPDGKNIQVKLLSNYIETRKGNCVSMPILMMLLADRMGLDVSLSYAPRHSLMKFTETETGKTFNVEATSGGGFSRDQWYQEKMQVTDDEIRNKVYLQKLSRKETAYSLTDLLIEHYLEIKANEKALDFSKFSLDKNPESVHFMLEVGVSYVRLLKEEYFKYERISEIPPKDRPRFYFLREQNQKYFQMAEARGWREKPIRTNSVTSRTVNIKKQTSSRYGT